VRERIVARADARATVDLSRHYEHNGRTIEYESRDNDVDVSTDGCDHVAAGDRRTTVHCAGTDAGHTTLEHRTGRAGDHGRHRVRHASRDAHRL
jgi:hypothetical protein